MSYDNWKTEAPKSSGQYYSFSFPKGFVQCKKCKNGMEKQADDSYKCKNKLCHEK